MSLFQQAVDPYYIYITKLASSAHFMHKEYTPHKESNFTARVKVKSSNGKNVGGEERLYPLLSFCFLMNAAGRLIKVSGMNFLFLCKLSGRVVMNLPVAITTAGVLALLTQWEA